MKSRMTTVLRAASLASVLACARPAAPVVAPMPIPVPIPPVVDVAPSESRAPIASAIARAQGSMQEFVDSLVDLPQFASAHWGVLIVAPDRSDTLASVQADRLVMPASNQKLVTGAVALAQLGADFTWPTAFTRTGPIVRGTLRGDLVITGTGDPSVSSAMRPDPLTAFDPLIAALRGAGVTRISGRVVPDSVHAFPGSPLGFGWDWDDLDAAYGAGVTELLFNEGFADVVVRGCAGAGSAACVRTLPARSAPAVHSTVTTTRGATDISWWRDSMPTPGIAVRGTIAVGDSMRFSVAQPDGRATYVAAVREALTNAGIAVGGARPRAVGRDTVVVLRSAPLREVLGAMQKTSQNQIAEVVFRTVGRVATGVGTPDSARAVVERQLTAWSIRRDAHAVRDGSGLSRHDYITPRALVQILDTMRRSPTFDVFRDALPTPGTDGTLKNRMRTLPVGRVQAKTGTIDKARALSGYVTTADGETLLFSIVANNYTVSTREVDRIAELIVERLVHLRRTVP
jgi:serine-type D-Ala-D-Ala carboxypeptidase/endopeptidase (penicillin-binding protein 4)